MGIDARIFIKARSGDVSRLVGRLPSTCEVLPANGRGPRGATHEVSQRWRYYGPGYERGPWPEIAAALTLLLDSLDVAAVWYFPDCDDAGERLTPRRLRRIASHYAGQGHRRYRDVIARLRVLFQW